MKSDMNFRGARNQQFVDNYLILHHCITNIFNQATKLIRILNIVEEALNIPLLYQLLELLEDVSQFPNSPCLSDSPLDIGEYGLAVPISLSFLAPWHPP